MVCYCDGFSFSCCVLAVVEENVERVTNCCFLCLCVTVFFCSGGLFIWELTDSSHRVYVSHLRHGRFILKPAGTTTEQHTPS